MNNLPVNMSLNKTFVSLHLRLEKCKPKSEKYNDLDIREKAYRIPSSSHNTVIFKHELTATEFIDLGSVHDDVC